MGDLLFFSDPITSKAIQFFDLRGKRRLSVPLDSVLGVVGVIQGISILTADSILILGQHNNIQAWINRSGHCFASVEETSSLTGQNVDVYWMYASSEGSSLIHHKALYHIEWRENNRWKMPDYRTDMFTFMTIFHNQGQAKPFFAQFDLDFLHHPQPRFGLPGFYNRFCKGPARTFEGMNYAELNGHLLLYSNFVDTLYILDHCGLDVERTVPIHSSSTAVYIPPPLVTRTEASNNSAGINARIRNGGIVSALGYDEASSQYLVIVHHQTASPMNDSLAWSDRPFSVLAFDTTFAPKGEYVFDDLRYDGFFPLSTSAGVYLKRHEDRATMVGGVHVFDRIEFK